MQDFKKLEIWSKAREMNLRIHKVTRGFPSDERFGLIAQMRSASASIYANIAEGRGRGTDPDFKRFLGIAMGSAYELEAHLIISLDLEFIKLQDFKGLEGLLTEIRRMLLAFMDRLRSR